MNNLTYAIEEGLCKFPRDLFSRIKYIRLTGLNEPLGLEDTNLFCAIGFGHNNSWVRQRLEEVGFDGGYEYKTMWGQDTEAYYKRPTEVWFMGKSYVGINNNLLAFMEFNSGWDYDRILEVKIHAKDYVTPDSYHHDIICYGVSYKAIYSEEQEEILKLKGFKFQKDIPMIPGWKHGHWIIYKMDEIEIYFNDALCKCKYVDYEKLYGKNIRKKNRSK